MNVRDIITEHYRPGTDLYDLFMRHAHLVTQKSLEMAATLSHLNPDTDFIREAAMLHDIGIFMTHAPAIHCRGSHPYVCHGFLGRQLLDNMGLFRHALVSERHTGAGITLDNIKSNRLPLPLRDMVPESLEEKIICVADKFYSKSPEKQGHEPSVEEIISSLSEIDPGHGRRFFQWACRFHLCPSVQRF
ncbi:uncharacterized protein SAMN02746065_12147 [Desulfocicer vacuolatum DSM 3385]|uniref:HD domain-containing protein n=1 Tax=Desulfocicer vacuolatum DSM 3385 TaxID=1121400 RepID=A0A1W2DWR6_9BACT|nr:HD domain-containing protein [Desulfocicer vacuolatum]SMD01863.1 uncharacterized protein SAMN02746065_12147 [Desulfocicer vacuolatum DSM 3385]